jgi:hypothetical protein
LRCSPRTIPNSPFLCSCPKLRKRFRGLPRVVPLSRALMKANGGYSKNRPIAYRRNPGSSSFFCGTIYLTGRCLKRGAKFVGACFWLEGILKC